MGEPDTRHACPCVTRRIHSHLSTSRPIVPARFVRKLEKLEKLSRADRQAILDVAQNVHKIGARKSIETGDWSYLFLSGLACRYQLLEDGGRQITDFIVPGDLCSGKTALQDWGIGTLSQCTVAY